MRFFSELLSQSSEKDKKLFYLLSIIVFFIGALLRFYQLDKLPGPVFDEVFFPEYGYNYLTGREFFHVHPPLYNYISSIGIWIYFHLPWVDLPPIGTIEFKDLEAISYRWINAVFGTLLVLITLITTLRLTKSKSAALIASLFVAIDGSIVVDSRFGMNNIFLIVFGFLAIWATLKAHQLDKNKEKWFFIAAIF